MDGQAYNLFGVPDAINGTQAAEVTDAKFTSTHSIFTLNAGSKTITLDFLSPVSPKNYLRQSLPFAYLTVTVNGNDSADVQVYSDIDASWTSKPDDS